MSALGIIITRAKAVSAITAITGTGGLYPIELPQKSSPPCVLFNIIGGRDEDVLNGPIAGLYSAVIQADCIATTPTAVIALGEALRSGLPVANGSIATHTNVSITLGVTDFTDSNGDRTVYRRVLEFRLRYK